MGSRVRVAAAACLAASAVVLGGATAVPAAADPASAASDDRDPGADSPTRPDDARPDGKPRRPAVDEKSAPGPGDTAGDAADTSPGAPPDDAAPDAALDDAAADEKDQPGPPCCEDGREDCVPGWPWPWPWPVDPDDDLDVPDKDRPVGMPPTMPSPPVGPQRPAVLDTVPGVGLTSDDMAEAPIDIPVVIAAPAGLGPLTVPGIGPGTAGGARAGTGPVARTPASPREATPSPPTARESLPATAGNSVALPSSPGRVGYGEYLRTAGIPQIAALALPGLAGILILTGAGGLVGYRQAKAGRGVRSSGIARFMN